MIIEAEIIGQPPSGEYRERIYDNGIIWNDQSWTFIKFTNDDYTEWCGHFRGVPRQVAISTPQNIILVLTSACLYQLDRGTGNWTDQEDHPTYHNLTVAPNGDFILADYYNIEKVTTNIQQKEPIESPIEMDGIEFKKWINSMLVFTCEELMNWDREITMTYDYRTNKIEVENYNLET